VIVGSGLAAWMAAAALARAVRREDWSIAVLHDDRDTDSLPCGDADATLPLTQSSHFALETDEDAVVAKTGGAFTYGIAFSGWSGQAATWFQPFGDVGATLGHVPFHHVVMRLRHEGLPLRLANYSLAALAAQAGRFSRPGRDPRSVLSTCKYGLHLDCAKFEGMLRRQAVSAGVTEAPGTFANVEPGADGSIAAVIGGDGTRMEGDLFLDCTGTDARLSSSNGQSTWEDWSEWLRCDRFMSARVATQHAPLPYSLSAAHSAGWIRHLPLRSETQLTCFYRSDMLTDAGAAGMLREQAGHGKLREVRNSDVRFGRRTDPWHGNCVALGSAAARLDPMAISNLQLLRASVDNLLRLLPAERTATVEAREYNRLMGLQFDHARDFAILHYKLNGRHGEAMWDACRTMPIPGTLDYKLRSYESRGRIALYDEEPLDETSWLNLFDEHGVRPRRYTLLVEGFATAELKAHVERVREIMLDELRRMPMHSEYLARLQAPAHTQ
jgi:tryptophan 7-halogenase